MAFSTQKHFMTLDPIERRGTNKNRQQYNTGIKHYGSCFDARAWSSDDTERNLFLSELISCRQDFYNENGKADCTGHINSDLKKVIKHSRTDKILYRSNSQGKYDRHKGFHQSNQYAGGESYIRDGDRDSEHERKIFPLYEQESSSSASSRTSKDENKLSRPLFGQQESQEAESVIAANENVPGSLLNTVEDPNSENIHAQENFLSNDLAIDESTLEFILINELVKGRKSTHASFVHGPSGLKPTLTSAASRGDCQKDRDNIRVLIESKGEETLAEIMKLLNRYQSRVQYYMNICQNQQYQIGKVDTQSHQFKIPQQITVANRPERNEGKFSKSKTKRPEVQFSFIHDKALRNKQSDYTAANPGQKLVYASNTSFPTISVSNVMNKIPSESSSQESPAEIPPNRKHKHSNLFFHQPNSVLSFQSAKKALTTFDRQQGLLKSLDLYSDELDGAVKNLARVLGEFSELKNIIGKLLKVGEPVPDYVRPESVDTPGTSQRLHKIANVNFRFPRNSPAIQVPGRNTKHFERNSAGAECDTLICEGQKQQLVDQCRQTIREIHKQFNNQFNLITATPEIKNKLLKMLNLQRETLQKFEEYNQSVLHRSRKIRDSLLSIESVAEETKVTGFARYSMKSGPSKNLHTKSIISLLRQDFSVDVDIAKIPIGSVDAIGRIDKILSARLAKLKSELEVIADKFVDANLATDPSLQSKSKVLKESSAIERKVIKRCRQIRALEQKVVRVRHALFGKSTTACYTHDQYCAKRTLKRIKALQKNLLEVSATAEFKKHMLHLSVAAENRTQKQNQRLKKDVMAALKIAHDLEGHINALKFAICGQILNSHETVPGGKKELHASSVPSRRQSAVIVQPKPSVNSNSVGKEVPISSAERLAQINNPHQQSNALDIESCSETLVESDALSQIYQRSSDVEQVNKLSSRTSVIEEEITPSIKYHMKAMQSFADIKSPAEVRTSISCAMAFSKPTCGKSRNEHSPSGIIVTLEPRNIIETPPGSLERNMSKPSIIGDDNAVQYAMETQTIRNRICKEEYEQCCIGPANLETEELYRNQNLIGLDEDFCQVNEGQANTTPYLMFPDDGYALESESAPGKSLRQPDPLKLIDILNDKNYVNFNQLANIGTATAALENPTALYQLLAEPIIQGAVDILTTDWIKEVNDLKMGFTSLKTEFQRLQQNEFVYQSKIKSLETDLYAASQTVRQLHEVQDTLPNSNDHTEVSRQAQVSDYSAKPISLLSKTKSEALECERKRNTELQKSIRNLKAELKKCQEGLHCLHAIHRSCSAVANPPKDEFQSKWIHDLEALHLETEVLRQELKQKDEELKEWQAGYFALAKAQTSKGLNNKWERRHNEPASQKLGGPSRSIRKVFEVNHNGIGENANIVRSFELSDENNADLRQRLVETLHRLDEEKKITSRLRQELEANFREEHLSYDDLESVQDFKLLVPFSQKSAVSTATVLNQSQSLRQIIEKQRSTIHYLSKLQNSVQGLLDRLTLVLRIECPKRFNLVNTKCYCDYERIRKKVRKIYQSLRILKGIGAFTLSCCDCTKASRLEQICGKISQKGIHNLGWNDLAYLHAVVFKAGRVVKKLKARTRQARCVCDSDAMQNEAPSQKTKPLKKIKKLEHDVAEARELIHMLKQECKMN